MNTNPLINKHVSTEDDMLAFGALLARVIDNGAIIFLYGPLGAGKTTLTRGFLWSLGYQSKVKSPTYTLVEPYDIDGRMIYHFDLYRLTDPKEIEHIGMREYFTPNAVCLIEWPEKGFPLLPAADLACYIALTDGGREVRVEAQSTRGQEILKRL